MAQKERRILAKKGHEDKILSWTLSNDNQNKQGRTSLTLRFAHTLHAKTILRQPRYLNSRKIR